MDLEQVGDCKKCSIGQIIWAELIKSYWARPIFFIWSDLIWSDNVFLKRCNQMVWLNGCISIINIHAAVRFWLFQKFCSTHIRKRKREGKRKDGAFRSVLAYQLTVDFRPVRVDTDRGVIAGLSRGSDTKERRRRLLLDLNLPLRV